MARFLEASLGDRKLRLYFCACLRRVWSLIPDPRSRNAVEVAERYADGQETPEALAEAGIGAEAVWRRLYAPAFWTDTFWIPLFSRVVAARFSAAQSAQQVTASDARKAIWSVCYGCYKAIEVAATWYAYLVKGVTRCTEKAQQAHLFRCEIGRAHV